jgi:hypothetical protein
MSVAPRSLAVVSRRSEPADSLDYFPTPPWATRALMHRVLGVTQGLAGFRGMSAHEPACGEGHMAVALGEFFGAVEATDIHDYGYGGVADYLGAPLRGPRVDWVVTNPPFNRAAEFLARAMNEARQGVALLLRSVWLHGQDRHVRIFAETPPSIVAPFAERVPMVKGRWDPEASTATDYCWFVWFEGGRQDWRPPATRVVWIAPHQRKLLTLPSDYDRFGAARPAPLLHGVAA